MEKNIIQKCGESKKSVTDDVVLMGVYPQGENAEIKPIEWLILKQMGNKAMLISKYALDTRHYNNSIGYESVTWETCSLRQWLIQDFFNQAFNSKEKANILTTNVLAHNNPEFIVDSGNATTDKVFLLSVSEAKGYFKSEADRQCVPTPYAKKHGAYTYNMAYGKTTCAWWLRTPGDDQFCAADVDCDGSIHLAGLGCKCDDTCVRPALCVNME